MIGIRTYKKKKKELIVVYIPDTMFEDGQLRIAVAKQRATIEIDLFIYFYYYSERVVGRVIICNNYFGQSFIRIDSNIRIQ